MEITRLILLRHGAPEAAARGRCYGELDVALSDEGRAQAQAAAARIGQVDTVYTSPRRRAIESAQIVAPRHEARIEPALREIDFGRFEGLTYDEAQIRDPDLYRLWMERPTEVTFPGGESWPLLRERVAHAAAQIRARHVGQSVLIVSHGGPLRALLAQALELPDANIFRIDQSFAAVSVIEYFGDLPLVKLVNG